MTVATVRSIRHRLPVSPDLLARIEAVAETPGTFDVGEAACASARTMGLPASLWTPEAEAEAMPRVLLDVCERCPVWTACLREAIRMNDVGYRASTTTSQRRLLFPDSAGGGRAVAGRPLAVAGDDPERRPRHPRGEGSLSRYRRGCRCDECRGCNAAARRRERGRAS